MLSREEAARQAEERLARKIEREELTQDEEDCGNDVEYEREKYIDQVSKTAIAPKHACACTHFNFGARKRAHTCTLSMTSALYSLDLAGRGPKLGYQFKVEAQN